MSPIIVRFWGFFAPFFTVYLPLFRNHEFIFESEGESSVLSPSGQSQNLMWHLDFAKKRLKKKEEEENEKKMEAAKSDSVHNRKRTFLALNLSLPRTTTKLISNLPYPSFLFHSLRTNFSPQCDLKTNVEARARCPLRICKLESYDQIIGHPSSRSKKTRDLERKAGFQVRRKFAKFLELSFANFVLCEVFTPKWF